MSETMNLMGVGIYSVPEAARLTGVSPGRIRRWIRGYAFKSQGVQHASPPVWQPKLPEIDGIAAIGFADLIEVRFVNAFRDLGVTWPTIRKAAQRASQLFGTSHPFSTKRFKTDGRSIFAEIRDDIGDPALIDLARSQYALERVLRPYLRGLEFSADDQVIRWWPFAGKRTIVIDPTRSFGQPIVAREGVPTNVLARAMDIEGNIDVVSRWYHVPTRVVRDAAEFEKKIAA